MIFKLTLKVAYSSALGLGLLLASHSLCAQVDPLANRTTPDQMSNQSGDGANTAAARDRMFLHTDADAGNAELQFSQLAVQKAASPDVKAFATKIVTDRTALNANIVPIVKSMGSDMPKKLAKPDQKELDKLNGLSGADFDKEYLRVLFKQRQKDHGAYQIEIANGGSPDAKSYAGKSEHALQATNDELNKLMQVNGVTP